MIQVTGLAKDLEEDQDETHGLARSGTPFYTAPERLLPKAVVDARCDLYSLGVLVYFLICGRLPYDPGGNWIDTVLNRDPIPLSLDARVPASLERVIVDCMSRDPNGRPPSARGLLDRLEALDDMPGWTQEEARAACASSA